jgi:hypothetical protein
MFVSFLEDAECRRRERVTEEHHRRHWMVFCPRPSDDDAGPSNIAPCHRAPTPLARTPRTTLFFRYKLGLVKFDVLCKNLLISVKSIVMRGAAGKLPHPYRNQRRNTLPPLPPPPTPPNGPKIVCAGRHLGGGELRVEKAGDKNVSVVYIPS